MALVVENRTILKDANGAQIIVPERSSGPSIGLTLVDEAGAAVPLAAIDTATLTLYARDEPNQPIINALDRVDIKNTGRGTIHVTSGRLTLVLLPLDNVIVNSSSDLEWHRALIEVGYSTVKALKYEVEFAVRNLAKVP